MTCLLRLRPAGRWQRLCPSANQCTMEGRGQRDVPVAAFSDSEAHRNDHKHKEKKHKKVPCLDRHKRPLKLHRLCSAVVHFATRL
jgi:hypothetical protein